jgi:tetrahydromethanopterin S-methyltransferase subunit C
MIRPPSGFNYIALGIIIATAIWTPICVITGLGLGAIVIGFIIGMIIGAVLGWLFHRLTSRK